MATDPYVPEKREKDEINELSKINESFKDENLLERLRKIEKLGKELEVGGQTSYQNRKFVLNEVEFPEGTSGKSRQAIFEAAVRVDSLRGLVFDYNKTIGEIKIAKAKVMKAEHDIKNAETEWEKLQAEGEYDVSMTELRQKEQALFGMEQRSKHLLRSIHDFYEEFEINEEKCKQLGFDCHDWNKMEVEDHYWRTVNDKKIIKQKMYMLGGLSKEGGDSLPLQNNLDVRRVKMIGSAVEEEARRMIESQNKPQQDNPYPRTEGEPGPNRNSGQKMVEEVKNWMVETNDKKFLRDDCPHRTENGKCKFRGEDIVGACTFRYCYSLGLNIKPIE